MSSDTTKRHTTAELEGRYETTLGGPCYIFAAAGTYTVSIQFQALSGGNVAVRNRRLYVQALPFA
jgi:hypothetical protein